MTREENIRAILECNFAGCKEEFIDIAVKRICELEQKPFFVKSDGTIEQIKDCENCLYKKEWEKIGKLISALFEKQIDEGTTQTSEGVTRADDVLDRIKSEIADLHLIGYATINGKREIASRAVMQIIDKYIAERQG